MKKLLIAISLFLITGLLTSCTLLPSTSYQKSPSGSKPSIIVLPTGEDVIRNLTKLINEGRVDDAVSMLGPDLNPDENSKQAWTNNFSNIKSINLKTIEPWEKDSWTANKEVYKAVLEVQLKVGSAAYGWANGDNTKWIEINKAVSPWKIDNIATGP